jgi:hypothetical protein
LFVVGERGGVSYLSLCRYPIWKEGKKGIIKRQTTGDDVSNNTLQLIDNLLTILAIVRMQLQRKKTEDEIDKRG